MTTKDSYECQMRQFWRFCAMKGDYDSMFLLLITPPTHLPAVSVDTLEQFLRFKRIKVDEPLLDKHGKPVLDVLGHRMSADGGWKAPNNVDTLRAATYDLHLAHGHTCDYEETCEDCFAKPLTEGHHGCDHHSGMPRFARKGNATRHITFTNSVTKAKGYVEKGSSQLLPSDFCLLAKHLLSTQSISQLQMWVIIIVATKLGLRHDEFHEIEGKDFVTDLFEIPQNKSMINALALKVFGKSDERWVTMKLIADHVYPLLCPVRAVLVYPSDWIQRRLLISIG